MADSAAPDTSSDAYPRLDQHQLDAARRLGRTETSAVGDILFEAGQGDVDFFIVIDGEIVVEPPHPTDERHLSSHRAAVRLGAGQFTGEIDMLSHRKALFTAKVARAGSILRMSPTEFRAYLQSDFETSEVIMRAFVLRREDVLRRSEVGAVVVGAENSADTLRIRSFLSRNGHPHGFVDVERDEAAAEILKAAGVTVDALPIVIGTSGVMRNPSNQLLADQIGIHEPLAPDAVHDLVVVGAGAGGLAAAVYGACEGLDVVVVEAQAPGGQAASSSMIENYLGFPTGISGEGLAERAYDQAIKFGADVVVSRPVVGLDCSARPYRIALEGGESLRTRAMVIASGAHYRKLPLANLAQFEGRGVYYAATHMEGQLCHQEEVIVVGGGNSAGQAAAYLATRTGHVHLLVRADGLAATMSRYLTDRIDRSDRITLRTKTEITALAGEGRLEEVTWRSGGVTETHPIRHVFLMVGAEPNTGWVRGCLDLDGHGFIRTGDAIAKQGLSFAFRTYGRMPFPFETSIPGVFAVGDVRSGSVKRVASAVGEGSVSIAYVHRALNE